MPLLAPVVIGGGGGVATAGGTATAVGGLTVTELTALRVVAAAVTTIGVKGIVDDYLDNASEAEVDSVITRAGDLSRAEQSRAEQSRAEQSRAEQSRAEQVERLRRVFLVFGQYSSTRKLCRAS